MAQPYQNYVQREAAIHTDATGAYGRNSVLGIRVDKAAATLPASTNQTLFTISGGRVKVTLLIGEVTTVIQTQTTLAKVTSAPTVGTALDLCSTLDITADEVGTLYFVEGDGTALVGASSGGILNANGGTEMIIPAGVIRLNTAATSTGATKWQLWYLPLDNGATVVSG